jgi:hypothetical protein
VSNSPTVATAARLGFGGEIRYRWLARHPTARRRRRLEGTAMAKILITSAADYVARLFVDTGVDLRSR